MARDEIFVQQRFTYRPGPAPGVVEVDEIDNLKCGLNEWTNALSAYITRRVIDTRESAIRDALIALGWAPPEREITAEEVAAVLRELVEKRKRAAVERAKDE